jgi:hypothetical protein
VITFVGRPTDVIASPITVDGNSSMVYMTSDNNGLGRE